ncbi:YpdA family putative bacillithiol disulfide reductase [Hyunsoonleella ulvae]|uniref:YpdA family putative bacillithiol disulfide reductase n=1 Tax=Hyunsoonleella ulvae TaxID=2799948 RepID=UPI001939A2B5|nr:YpdA family putative bacillithiol disulfide reductase [Hyunsoonleella ulvae]
MKDVIIIGGGPIGIACALECKKRNWNYIIIEKGALTNSLFNYPKNMTFFSTSEKLEIDNIPFISKNPKPNRDEALEYYRRVATSNAININLFEKVEAVSKTNNYFKVQTDKVAYQTKNIIIATGFYDIPNLLDVPGENLPKVTHYYKEAHPYAMQNTVIVGASNSSVDAALEIYRKGGNVTMIVRGENIGKRVKYWVRPDIINRIEEGSINAHFNAEILEITEREVIFKSSQGVQHIPNDFVIALTGYKPNFDLLNQIGITQTNDEKHLPKYNPETMETNIKGVYLAGVICGGMETHKWFIENSRIHAKQIAAHMQTSFTS